MPKINIADIKFNKKVRTTVPRYEEQFNNSTSSITNKAYKEEVRKINETEQVYQPLKTNYSLSHEDGSNNVVEKNKDEKVNEYLNNKYQERPRLERTPQIKRRPKLLNKSILFIFILCVIFGLVYWGGNIFQKANVTITPKHQLISYDNKQFVASKDSADGFVNFEIMITSDKKTKNVILTTPQDVSIKAKGSITIYNEFSITSVKLAAGSFVSDNEGKTYKIDTAIVIPGYLKDASGEIIPGKVDVGITSFLPGDTYNGSPKDFQVSTFKGTSKYTKIYGKLLTPLLGGASGMVYVLDDVTKNNIASSVQSSLKDDLIKQVKALVPPGYILYPDAMNFTFDSLDDVISKTPEADINVSGSLSVVLLKEKNLMDNIIKVSLPNVSGDELKEISIPDLSKFKFNFTNKDQLITKDMETVSFTLSGNADALWTPNIMSVKTKLSGVSENAVLPIFKEDKGIASAVVKIFPPWKKNIPSDISKIYVITQ